MIKKKGFPPVSQIDARILILGSMPGERSLQKQEYYGHPQNLFWRIMGEILGFDPGIEYQKRLEKLKEGRIALWDVLRHCHREGSLDSSIKTKTEEANDFDTFLNRHPRIQRICFNGRKAETSFIRHVIKAGPKMAIKQELCLLPSTSPAYASLNFEAKCKAWKDKILN